MAMELLKRFFISLFVLLRGSYRLGRRYIEQRFSQHEGDPFVEQGHLPGKSGWQRAAIVALNADALSGPFLVNLMNGLAENEFFVLAVSNRVMPAAMKDSVLSRCHYLIEKLSADPNGSYKTGWDWILWREELKYIDTLIFANDSFFYPRHIASTIGQMLAQQANWIRLFDAPRISAEATLQLFRSSVFTAETFMNFWKNYTPASTHSLAVVLQKSDFVPQAYYNAARLQADVAAALDFEEIPADLGDVLNLTLGFKRRDRNNRGLRTKDALSMTAADVSTQICRLAESGDPEHAVGLLCNYLYQAPVKRDICAYDHHSAGDFLALAQGFSTEEKEAMANDLRMKSTSAAISNLHRIQQRLLHMAGPAQRKTIFRAVKKLKNMPAAVPANKPKTGYL